MEEMCNVEAAMVLAPLGHLTRLLSYYIFTTECEFGKPVAVVMVDIFASFVIGIITEAEFPRYWNWLKVGFTAGYCGCASTFGSLISLVSFDFILGIHHHSFFQCAISLAYLPICTEASRGAYDTGKCLCHYLKTWRRRNELPRTINAVTTTRSSTDAREESQEDSSHYKHYCAWLTFFFAIEVAAYIVIIPFYMYTSRYMFGFYFNLLGALTRYYTSKYLNPTFQYFYLGTYLCNVVGSVVACVVKMGEMRGSFSFVLGWFIHSLSEGFASALSTMSSYVKETVYLKSNAFPWFILYSWASIGISFGLGCLIFALSPEIYEGI